MKNLIDQTIEQLREKVKENLVEIQENQKMIRELLKCAVSNERSAKLEERYALNKALLAENNDIINVQLTLSNFVDKYSNGTIFDPEKVSVSHIGEQDCFEQTVNGKLAFNSKHPLYNDDTFFQKLMEHYQGCENYEACSRLMKEKKQYS